MTDLLKIMISLSFSGSLLMVFLFSCRRFLKERISRQWQYYAWLIVIARLLLPLPPEMNLAGIFFQAMEHTELQNAAGTPAGQDSGGRLPAQNEGRMNAAPVSRAMNQPEETVRNPKAALSDFLCLIWFATAVLLLMRKIFDYLRFVRYVKAGQTGAAAGGLSERLKVIAEQAGIRSTVGLCINPAVSSPMLIGLFCPCIVLPDADIPERDFEYTALHELTHFRRRDTLYKWLVQATVCAHWFNPLVYPMARKINEDCEFSCDEAVVRKLDADGAREYAMTLLHAMPVEGMSRTTKISVSLTENKIFLKERLGAIMRYQKKKGAAVCIMALLTALLLGGFAFTGPYTAEAKDKEEALRPVSREAKEKTVSHEAEADRKETSRAVSYEAVEMRRYEGGLPYIHDIRVNNTDKTIVSTQRGMTAFDKDGNPLLIDWNGMDSSSEPSYFFLYDWDDSELPPGETADIDGGWTLNLFGDDQNADKIAYVLYCDRQITFSDGTVWNNPGFESWRLKYEEKKTDVSVLDDYYPYVQTVELE